MRVLSFIFITGKAQKLCFVGADVKCDRFTFTMPLEDTLLRVAVR
ncbi:MAG: hypothetical protein K0R55_4114 [Sporomusa sp.]|nr:hypothetical protein [Sporomusa sp.]